MRLLLLVLFVLYFTGCGLKQEHKHYTDERLVEYIQAFEQEYNLTVGISYLVTPLDSLIAGECHQWSDGFREIRINESLYYEYLDQGKDIEGIVFHELGHCIFNRGHLTDKTSDGIPLSLMYPTTKVLLYYDEYKQYYRDELIQPGIEPVFEENEKVKVFNCGGHHE